MRFGIVVLALFLLSGCTALVVGGGTAGGYQDVRNAYHMALQNELLRKHATGNFERLVHDISRDPAMLYWLT